MRILATFVNFRTNPLQPELVHAADDETAEANPMYVSSSRQAAVEALGADVLNSVVVAIEVDISGVVAALNPVHTLVGGVVNTAISPKPKPRKAIDSVGEHLVPRRVY